MANIDYEKVGWNSSNSLGPTNFGHMDEGIKAACDGVDGLEEEVSQLNNTITGLDEKVSHIGDVYTYTLISQSVVGNTATSVAKIDLPLGTYIVTAHLTYPTNANGLRALKITSNATPSITLGNADIVTQAINGANTIIECTMQITVTRSSYTVYLETLHNISSTFTVYPKFIATRVG